MLTSECQDHNEKKQSPGQAPKKANRTKLIYAVYKHNNTTLLWNDSSKELPGTDKIWQLYKHMNVQSRARHQYLQLILLKKQLSLQEST